MAITVEAVYEDGVFRPFEALSLHEHERVQLTVKTAADLVQQTQGLIPWKGDPKVLEHFAMDPIDEL